MSDNIQALKAAVDIIKAWHNMPAEAHGVPKDQVQKIWNIYYNQAPEMAPIRQALQEAESQGAKNLKFCTRC